MTAMSNGMNIVRESPLQKDDTNPEMVRFTNYTVPAKFV